MGRMGMGRQPPRLQNAPGIERATPLVQGCPFQWGVCFHPAFFAGLINRRALINSDMYKKTLRVSELLAKVKTYILQYNNIIVGNNNAVNGNSNVVIGSRNSFTGNNDWVFASDYQSTDPQTGVLIIDNYLIELNEIFKISYNPREAIRCLKTQDSNNHFRGFWNGCRDRHRTMF